MSANRISRIIFGSVSLVIALGSASGDTKCANGNSIGESFLIDDFDDGNDDHWTRFDLTAGQDWGPGIYDLSDGSYNLRGSGSVPPGSNFTESAIMSSWSPSMDPRFSNGILQATIKTDATRNSTGLIMRGELATATGYLLLYLHQTRFHTYSK
jgi:hypothetical protein